MYKYIELFRQETFQYSEKKEAVLSSAFPGGFTCQYKEGSVKAPDYDTYVQAKYMAYAAMDEGIVGNDRICLCH